MKENETLGSNRESMGLIAEGVTLGAIREIVGDAQGKLMQDELVEKIRADYAALREWLEWWDTDTADWDGERSQAHWDRLDGIKAKLDGIFAGAACEQCGDCQGTKTKVVRYGDYYGLTSCDCEDVSRGNGSRKYQHIQSETAYRTLMNSGMFWEFHPELSGNWEEDRKLIFNTEDVDSSCPKS